MLNAERRKAQKDAARVVQCLLNAAEAEVSSSEHGDRGGLAHHEEPRQGLCLVQTPVAKLFREVFRKGRYVFPLSKTVFLSY